MVRDAVRSLVALLALTLLCGAAYPLIVWGGAQTLAGGSADGSLVVRDGRVVGSELLGQPFTSDRYFHGRPSAVSYAAAADGSAVPVSGGSNLGPTSRDLVDAVEDARAEVAAREGVTSNRVPVDLVTASASGLDPDISLEAALLQVPRVARERGLPPADVERLVRDRRQSPILGVLGAERVRVLDLNLALDERSGVGR